MLGLGVIGGSDCEALLDGLLAQPTNALTSVAFVVAGVVVWVRIPPQRRVGAGGVYAVLLGFVGIGSIPYHGPQPPGSKFLHDAPIPMLLVLIAAVAGNPLLHHRSALPGVTRVRRLTLLGIGAVAGLAYVFGRTGSPISDPDSWLQLHGVWHIATAVAFVVVADMLFPPDQP